MATELFPLHEFRSLPSSVHQATPVSMGTDIQNLWVGCLQPRFERFVDLFLVSRANSPYGYIAPKSLPYRHNFIIFILAVYPSHDQNGSVWNMLKRFHRIADTAVIPRYF